MVKVAKIYRQQRVEKQVVTGAGSICTLQEVLWLNGCKKPQQIPWSVRGSFLVFFFFLRIKRLKRLTIQQKIAFFPSFYSSPVARFLPAFHHFSQGSILSSFIFLFYTLLITPLTLLLNSFNYRPLFFSKLFFKKIFAFYFTFFLYSRSLLVITFIHITVYLSIPIAQFITPPPHTHRRFPPLVSICLFSTSVSQFLPCKPVHLYHFSRFHIYALISNTCFSLSDLLHSV